MVPVPKPGDRVTEPRKKIAKGEEMSGAARCVAPVFHPLDSSFMTMAGMYFDMERSSFRRLLPVSDGLRANRCNRSRTGLFWCSAQEF
jgi:hypothetical protein